QTEQDEVVPAQERVYEGRLDGVGVTVDAREKIRPGPEFLPDVVPELGADAAPRKAFPACAPQLSQRAGPGHGPAPGACGLLVGLSMAVMLAPPAACVRCAAGCCRGSSRQ